MMNETEIANRLKEYDDAFDFYMERGRMPDNIPQEDLLGGFLQQTLERGGYEVLGGYVGTVPANRKGAST